ncbi:Glycosyl transferase, group 1 domain protein [Candidatus Magnetomorum sp. HK-1]|nr:Glycosyl transferase, group 1 domain protein [Candidatus Magnetomorum sp. HK-1]
MKLEAINLPLHKKKMGRKIAENSFSSLVDAANCILRDSGIHEQVALMTYGSAGGQFLLSNSDTDFILLGDDSLPEKSLLDIQNLIFTELASSTWTVGFKAWKRVKVNPMDLLSTRFICGNLKIFEEKIVHDPIVESVNNNDILISTLAGIDLHLEFMASHYFSRLVRTYHPTKEFPSRIGYGDIKYFTGGVRWIQAIYTIAMLYSKKKFISDADVSVLVNKGIFHDNELHDLHHALDFFLSAKDICVKGNNILFKCNVQQIEKIWEQPAHEIRTEYAHHIKTIETLFRKAHQSILANFPSTKGVVSRKSTNAIELTHLINTNALELWKTIALRKDVTADIREYLTKKIVDRQKYNPHTMLDEMVAMLQFSSTENQSNNSHTTLEIDEKISLWVTDNVFECFEKFLINDINNPALVRLAVHNSFFYLFKSGQFSDIQTFYKTYIERVKKFFHCRSIEPEYPFAIAEAACLQILNSGFFKPNRVTLLELHPTNHCNLQCSWCTYKSKDSDKSIQFDDLSYVSRLSPMEILIAGGGEPTLFKESTYSFTDVIHFLRTNLPGTRLRLITNGTLIPKGDWLAKVDEISVSVDNECSKSYLSNKGKNLFDAVWKNIQVYLYESSVPIIRVTKIFNQHNLVESITLAEKLYSIWNNPALNNVKRHYFRFMLFPMANDKDQKSPYDSSKLSISQKTAWENILSSIKSDNPDLHSFLITNTNLLDIANIEPTAPPAEKCWTVTNYLLIGADRKIYPCFVTCSSFKSLAIGSLDITPESLTKIRENLFSYPPLQCSAGCRPGSIFYGLRSKEYYIDQRQLNLPGVLKSEKTSQHQIVHVSCQDPASLVGGQGWAVYNLCKEQVKHGQPIYWISPCIKQEKPGEYLYENGLLRVIKLKFTDNVVTTLFSNESEAHELRIRFGDTFVDYIKCHFTPENCAIHLHGFIEIPRRSDELRKLGYRVISTFHMLLSARNDKLTNMDALSNGLRESERLAINCNTIISVPSKGMVKELVDVQPDYKGLIKCIKNGIGDEYFSTPIKQPTSSKKIIISYGRISPEKGFELLIDAAKIIIGNMSLQDQPPLQFIIFGNVDNAISARRIYADKLTESVSGYDSINILATPSGIVGIEKINMIDQALIGVIPSLYEPFGMVIPELMARRKPIITTLTPGAQDILQTNKIGRNDFGFIIEPTAASLVEAITWMLSNPSGVNKMGENAIKRASAYKWSHVANLFNQLYWK